MRRTLFLLAALAAILPMLALAQDAEDNPEVRGTAVVGSDEPTIEQPTINVDNPDSKVPNDLTKLTPLQTWQMIAAGLATGATSLLLRWIPMPRAAKKREDRRKAVAFAVAAVMALIGAGINGDLDNWQPTLSGVIYVAGLAWFAYEKLPSVRNVLTSKVEGRAATTP